MGHYFLDVRIIGRSSGKSAVAAAAYRSGERLHNDRTEQNHDYTRKGSIEKSAIYAPNHAPDWTLDRGKLWNGVEQAEKRKDAQLAREVIVSLPRELPEEKRFSLVENFIKNEFVSKGMIADVSWHNPKAGDGGENPHAHIMLTMRDVSAEGFGKKNREWNTAVFTKDDMVKDKSQLVGLRASWADYVNNALNDQGSNARVSHLSHEEQGLKPPTPSMPFAPHHINRRTENSHVYDDIMHERHFKQVEQFKSQRATPSFQAGLTNSQQIADYEYLQRRRRNYSPPVNSPEISHRNKLLQRKQQQLDNDIGVSI